MQGGYTSAALATFAAVAVVQPAGAAVTAVTAVEPGPAVAAVTEVERATAVAAGLRGASRVGRRSEGEAVTAIAEEQPAVLSIGAESGAVGAVADQATGVRGGKRGVGLRGPRIELSVDRRAKRAVDPSCSRPCRKGTQRVPPSRPPLRRRWPP